MSDDVPPRRFEFFMVYKNFYIVRDRRWNGFRGISIDDSLHTGGRFTCEHVIREIERGRVENSPKTTLFGVEAHSKPTLIYVEGLPEKEGENAE
jgi:hypothetical protein